MMLVTACVPWRAGQPGSLPAPDCQRAVCSHLGATEPELRCLMETIWPLRCLSIYHPGPLEGKLADPLASSFLQVKSLLPNFHLETEVMLARPKKKKKVGVKNQKTFPRYSTSWSPCYFEGGCETEENKPITCF